VKILQKAIGYLGLDAWFPLASRQDGRNFRTNQVTLADYQDSGAGTANSVMGLAAAWACVRLVSGTISSLPLNIESTLEQTLLSPVERDAGMRIEFNIDGLLRGDSKSRSEFYSAGLKDKWLVVNEVRAKENLPPVAWGDRPWGQMQDTQLNELGQVVPVTAPREAA
jgi:phage portal protein BeeE